MGKKPFKIFLIIVVAAIAVVCTGSASFLLEKAGIKQSTANEIKETVDSLVSDSVRNESRKVADRVNEFVETAVKRLHNGDTFIQPVIEGLEIPAYIHGHEVVRHTGYTLSWNSDCLVPDWVAYELTAKELDTQEVSRTEDFRPDPAVHRSSTLEDYRSSGYSRGHMAPAQDFKWSANAMSDTFFLTNMVPQLSGYNGGIWLVAENAVRDCARITGTVYVVTGPVLTDGPYTTIGPDKVTVPKSCYKAVLVITENQVQAIAMVIPQTAGKKERLNKYLMSVNDLESLIRIDLFPSLDDSIEEPVENSYNINFWPESFR